MKKKYAKRLKVLEAFRKSGLEISPIHLPLSRLGPQEFPELRRTQAFGGLPGVLADALPDAFGNAVIKRYFEQRGTPEAALSPVQKLLYIGGRAMGALEFKPAIDAGLNRAVDDAIEVARLTGQRSELLCMETDAMAMGRRRREQQGELFLPTQDLALPKGHVFYDRLNLLLAEAGFDDFVEALCKPQGIQRGGAVK